MPRDPLFIAFDLETTGLDPGVDRVVEIGAMAFDAHGLVVETFERLVNPGRPMGEVAIAISGLVDADLAGAPAASIVLPEFLAFLERAPDAPLLAHNSAFDAGFLGMELARAELTFPGVPVLDTLALARTTLPNLGSHRLDRLVEHFGIAARVRHRALGDASAVMDLWFRLGGPGLDATTLTSYPIYDGSQPVRPPLGWDRLDEAAGRGSPVRIAYAGGSRGEAPRLVTPRRFAHRGGMPYLVATCHLDSVDKSFRLDRIRSYEVLDDPRPPEASTPCPDCS
ncbi:exonuclease domain-containing protein [Paludisphaera soli]|uniref:exonuclease domain-containing protein n=1 Tax=Paludisphaera soli TaxID=2712865 RepID=UPI0013ED23F5|nr:exonuclease domain-containing protein [Paludisphaera soli]